MVREIPVVPETERTCRLTTVIYSGSGTGRVVAYSRCTFGYIRHENLCHTVLPVTSHLCQMTKYVCIQYFLLKRNNYINIHVRSIYLRRSTKRRNCDVSSATVTIVCWLCEDASLSQLHVGRCDKFSATKSRRLRSMFKDIFLTGGRLGKDVIERDGSDKCRVYVGYIGLNFVEL